MVRKAQATLQAAGAWSIKVIGGAHTPPGTPDIIACYRGQFLAIEMKTETGRVRPAQNVVANLIRKAGGHYHIVRNIAEIKHILKIIDDAIDYPKIAATPIVPEHEKFWIQ